MPTVAGAGPSQDTAAVQACERLLPVDPSRRERWVRFERRVLDTSDYGLHDGEWSTSNAPLCALEARAAGTIEDDGEGSLIGTVDISTTKVAEKGGRKKGVAGGHVGMEVDPVAAED